MSIKSFARALPLVFVLSEGFFAAPVAAQTSSLAEAMTRIDISGRQRMFAQRMVGLSCLVSLDIDAETHAREALEIRDQFGQTLADLRNGNADLGIAPVSDIKVKIRIADTYEPFDQISELISVFETQSTLSTTRLQAISVASNQVFDTSVALTSQVQTSGGASLQDLPLIKTMIINISGRQRMLAEKAFKEFCLAQAGADAENNLQLLSETVNVFDNTLMALINGMPGVILPPPNDEVAAKLDEVRNVWVPVKSILERAIGGEIMDHTEVHFATEELETVRSLMNEAVSLYDQAEG